MNNMTTTKEIWLQAPEEQLDNSIKNIIRDKWDDDPTAIQILEAVDHCVYWGASLFVVTALNAYMQAALKREGKTFEELITEATWRDDHV